MKVRLFVLILGLFCHPAFAENALSGLALHGTPKYASSFSHFDYVNPEAPKGGDLRLSSIGTFDTINPFTLKGIAEEGAGILFETLMAPSKDEAFSQYGWVAETVTVAKDHTSVSYHLRHEARFQDGSHITPEDIIFSFETLRDKGHPFYRSYYKDVSKAEKTGPLDVTFTFRDTTNSELPLIMGQLPVLSKTYWQGKDFSSTTLDSPLSSGPYKIESLKPGRSIVYRRIPNWWAKDLPINRGRYNFDTIRYDYYRDSTIALEAFLAGRYDFRLENSAKNWALQYTTPALAQGFIKKEAIPNALPAGMQGFIMNTRREIFKDRRVREALNYVFDFEWSNKNFAYGAYQRTASYFENSELAGHGLPNPAELKLLEPFKGKIPDEVFTREFIPPTTDGSGENRENMKKALELLHEAGWNLKNGTLQNAKGQPFVFEIIEVEPMFERWTQPFLRNLERLGIKASFRIVDASQFQNRLNDFNFDMTVSVFSQSLSPGNEQFDYWSSSKADIKGSRNLIGIKDPIIDQLLERLVHTDSRDELITVCHVLDRVLLWNYYVIPHWYIGSYRVAYWDMFGKPPIAPKYGLDNVDDWWIDSTKAAKIIKLQERNR